MANTVKKLLDHAKQSATDAFKAASKRAIQKTAEATGDVIDNKIANMVKWWRFPNIHNKIIQEQLQMSMIIPKERHISPEERQEIIDELGLK